MVLKLKKLNLKMNNINPNKKDIVIHNKANKYAKLIF